MKAVFLACALYVASVMAIPSPAGPTQPSLAQAWTATGEGDGLPGKVGHESYLYEECKSKGGESDDCKQVHANGKRWRLFWLGRHPSVRP